MDVLSFAEARAKLAQVMKRVVADHNPVVIQRGAEAVVLVSLADWRARQAAVRVVTSRGNDGGVP